MTEAATPFADRGVILRAGHAGSPRRGRRQARRIWPPWSRGLGAAAIPVPARDRAAAATRGGFRSGSRGAPA